MAIMIPDIRIESIQNLGERDFYQKASLLSDKYTVLYSYKYQIDENDSNLIREADFVIVHQSKGFVVVEIKQGSISYHNGTWNEFKEGKYQALHKDPVEQASSAMYEIINTYRRKSGGNEYPLAYKYAICFPESTKITGVIPQGLIKDSIWTANELENLDKNRTAF